MTQGTITAMISGAVFTVLKISLPIVLLALLIGFMISLFQAVTQIQEQTLTFVPKMVTVLLMLAFLAPYISTTLVEYTRNLWGQIPAMGPRP